MTVRDTVIVYVLKGVLLEAAAREQVFVDHGPEESITEHKAANRAYTDILSAIIRLEKDYEIREKLTDDSQSK